MKGTSEVDWLNLSCPIAYDEIQQEVMMSLKPDLFEGLHFDFTNPLDYNIFESHNVFMGSTKIPSQSTGTLKFHLRIMSSMPISWTQSECLLDEY